MRENYLPHSSDYRQPPKRYRRKFDYLRDDDFEDERDCRWNMSHQPRYHESSAVSSSSNKSRRNASNRSLGFHSFFRWFKKDDKNRNSKDIRFPLEVTSSTDTLDEYDDRFRSPPVQFQQKYREFNRKKAPNLGYGFSQSSSCDSIFSTASSFAFVPPKKYLRNQRQVR